MGSGILNIPFKKKGHDSKSCPLLSENSLLLTQRLTILPVRLELF